MIRFKFVVQVFVVDSPHLSFDPLPLNTDFISIVLIYGYIGWRLRLRFLTLPISEYPFLDNRPMSQQETFDPRQIDNKGIGRLSLGPKG